MRNLSSFKVGEKGVIAEIKDKDISVKLLEMGCVPGSEVLLFRKAPLGDPICIEVAGYQLTLRKVEASAIVIK